MMMQARPVLAVLDTNVVISGLLWEGTPRDLLARAIHGQGLLLAASAVLVQELAATLSLPRFASKIQASGKSIEELVLAYSDAVTLVSPRDVPRVVVEDIDDDHVIAATVAAGASCIVTGDRSHLLPIGVHADTAIISPRHCLDLLD
jgi:uncharacterized protein